MLFGFCCLLLLQLVFDCCLPVCPLHSIRDSIDCIDSTPVSLSTLSVWNGGEISQRIFKIGEEKTYPIQHGPSQCCSDCYYHFVVPFAHYHFDRFAFCDNLGSTGGVDADARVDLN